MHESRLVQHKITSGYIKIVVDDHSLPAYWAHPEVGGTFPGLVLLHEWWGLTPHMRTQVRRFAGLGFYVIAPDLFNGQIANNADHALELQQQLGEAGMPLVNATINVLQTHHRVNGKMGMVGWHMGGKLAFHAAMHRNDLDAVVAFYARPDDYLALMPADETPILAFYADNDQTASPAMIDRVRTALAQGSAKNKVVAYPGTTTGFFNDDLPTFQLQAATDAWYRTLDFLCEHLDIQAPGKTARPVI